LKSNPKIILDIATGTGDLAILMAQTKAEKNWFRYLCWYARGRRKENCFKKPFYHHRNDFGRF
jgi:hypothetical protein